MTATTAVNIRTKPTTSSPRIGVLYKGQKVKATGSSNGWTAVTWKGKKAHIYSQYLTGGSTGSSGSSSAVASKGTVTTTANLNLREGPSLKQRVVKVAKKGTALKLTGSVSGDFSQITHDGKTLWAATKYLKLSSSQGKGNSSSQPPSANQGSVYTTANLNLRKGPSLTQAVVRVAGKGTKLSLTGSIDGAYSQVVHNGQTLWAATQYLSQSSSPSKSLPAIKSQGKATTALMIRTTSGSDFKSLGDVPKGTILDLTGKVTNGMAQIVWQGNVRWVNNTYVTKVSDKTGPSKPSLPSTSTRYATANLNIWHQSTGSAHTGEIARGSKVAVTGTVKNGRAEVVHNGTIRWVTAQYLDKNKPSSGSSNGGDINKGFSSGLHKTNASIQRITWHIWDNWPQIKTMYGWRQDTTPDHPAGKAVDVMLPNYKSNKALGWEIATYYRQHAKEFDIHYIIFDQQIWNIQRDSEGWRPMASRGSDTANHKDHVHINSW